jgi:flavodoxin
MVKVLVVYDTKYGNTKIVGEKIVEGMREVGGIDASICNVGAVNADLLPDFDVILIGSPNHYGGSTKSVKEFIDMIGELNLEDKQYAVFDTFVGKDSDFFFEKAVKKMERRIGEKVPGLKLLTSGLSIRVKGSKGPIVEGELPKCIDFGKQIRIQEKT